MTDDLHAFNEHFRQIVQNAIRFDFQQRNRQGKSFLRFDFQDSDGVTGSGFCRKVLDFYIRNVSKRLLSA